MSRNNSDNRSNQMNPNNDAYWQSRGLDERPDDWRDEYEELEERNQRSGTNNRSNQINPNHWRTNR